MNSAALRRGPLRAHGGGGVAVFQRLFDAFLIFASHYVSHLLYPAITRAVASIGVAPAANYAQQTWTSWNTLASVTAIVTFQVMAEAHGLYRSWQGVAVWRELVSTLVSWFMALPVLLFLAFVTKTSEVFSRSISLVWFFGT